MSLCVAAILLAVSNLEAQWPATASPFVPARHWSYEVLRRLDVAGLLPRGADVARRSIPLEEIAGLFRAALQRDTTGNVNAYLTRLGEEFGFVRGSGISWVDRSVGSGYELATDQVHAGVGYDTVWTGARPVDDVGNFNAEVRLAAASRYLAGAIAHDRHAVTDLQIVLATRAVGVWGGRKEIGFAPAYGGGIVVNNHTFDGAGVFLARPLELPIVGSTRFELHLSKIDNVLNFNNSQDPIEPWFWTARASFEPHARFKISATRGMMFGGEGNVAVTPSRVLKNVLGIYTSNGENSFANQIASIDMRLRLATGAIPVSAYVELAADDAYGAWWHVPGVVGGVEISGLPRRDIVVGLERAEFEENDLTRSLWYQNAWFRGSWADDGVLLGHPLAGNGVEWRAFGSVGSPLNGITMDMSAYIRNRRSENLLAPQRAGRSRGATLKGDARINASTRASFQAEIEHGTSGWTAATANAGIRLDF